MKKLTKTMILLLCITVSTFIVFAQTGIDYTQVGEDIEIMAKVIDKTIQKEFPDDARIGTPFFSRGFSGCQGVYLKGYGAIFMTSIGFPVAEKKLAQGEERPDDLWQQTKSELAGTGGRGYGSSIGEYDSEKAGKLKEELLKVIGAYGSNIRQLASQENIVVAINGTSSPFQPFLGYTGSNWISADAFANALVVPGPAPEAPSPPAPSINAKPDITEGHSTGSKEPEEKQKEAPKKADEMQKKVAGMGKNAEIELKVAQKDIANAQKDYEKAINEYRIIGMPEATGRGRTTLIIKVSKENIMAYKNKAIDLDKFLEKAEITQY